MPIRDVQRLQQPQRTRSADSVLVVGLGSPHGDDRAGWIAAERIANRLGEFREMLPRGKVRVCRSPLELLDHLGGVERLVLCDACRGLGPPGTWRQWTWPTDEWHNVAWSGTHDWSLNAAIELARQLKKVPDRVEIWGIELQSAKPHDELSPHVAAAMEPFVNAIWESLFDA